MSEEHTDPLPHPKEKSPEVEPERILKRKRSKDDLLAESPIKKVHTVEDNKKSPSYGEAEDREKVGSEKDSDSEEEKRNEKGHEDEGEEEDEPKEQENQNLGEEEDDKSNEEGDAEDNPTIHEKETKKPKSPYIIEIPKSIGKKIKEINLFAADGASSSIIEEMKKAYEEDLKCLQKKQPALHKIKVLNEIEKSLKNSATQAEFVKKDGLEILEKWLKPQPDGTQPSLYLKRKILENLNMFALEKEQFSSTDLGKVVNKICLSQSEPNDVRRLAKTIIDKWTRLLTDNHIYYGRYAEEDDNDESSDRGNKSQMDKKKSSEIDVLNSQKKDVKYVLLPKKNTVEFLKNVKTKASDNRKKNVADGTKEMYKILQNLRRNKNNM